MVGLFIDDEVRGLMRREAQNERTAGRIVGWGMFFVALVIVALLAWWLWPSKTVVAPYEPPAATTPHVPIKVDNVKSYAT